MKKITLVFLLFSIISSGQKIEAPSDIYSPELQKSNYGITNIVEEKAVFTKKGGISQFISKKIKYPKQALVNGIKGKVIVRFIVEKDGSISDVKIINNKLGYGLDEKAIQAIKLTSGKWKPGKINGKAVRNVFILPIVFGIN